MAEEWQRLCASPSGPSNYAEGGVMDIQRDEAFEEAYSKICKPIIARPYPRDANGEYVYKEIHEAKLMWQEAKAQVPEGFVLMSKSDLESWYLWDGDSENMYRDNYSESICDDVELGAVFEIDVKMAFKVPLIYVVPIYSDSDDYEYEEFESEELAQKAAAENKAMIEAQEQGQ